MESQGVLAAVTSAIGKAVDCKLDFYGNQVGRNAMYLIVAGSVILPGLGPGEIRGPGEVAAGTQPSGAVAFLRPWKVKVLLFSLKYWL